MGLQVVRSLHLRPWIIKEIHLGLVKSYCRSMLTNANHRNFVRPQLTILKLLTKQFKLFILEFEILYP